MELTSTSLAVYVNNTLYFAQYGVPELPADLLNGALYVYFSGVNVQERPSLTARFHWDRVAINNIIQEPQPPETPSDCRLQIKRSDGAWDTLEDPYPCP